jgi:hypothetical protein
MTRKTGRPVTGNNALDRSGLDRPWSPVDPPRPTVPADRDRRPLLLRPIDGEFAGQAGEVSVSYSRKKCTSTGALEFAALAASVP